MRHGVERNHITYSSLIAAAEKGCRCELALDLFAQMQKEGCKPNTVTFNSLVAACAAGARALGGGGGLGGGVLVHLCGLVSCICVAWGLGQCWMMVVAHGRTLNRPRHPLSHWQHPHTCSHRRTHTKN